jgi:hypothetical protein
MNLLLVFSINNDVPMVHRQLSATRCFHPFPAAHRCFEKIEDSQSPRAGTGHSRGITTIPYLRLGEIRTCPTVSPPIFIHLL